MYQHVRVEDTHASVEEIFVQSPVPRDQRFFNAIKTGDLTIVKLFIKEIPGCSEWLDIDGKRALHHAVIQSQVDVCRYMLENVKSLDINALDKSFRTPLNYATDERLKVILIAKGAIVRHVDVNDIIKSKTQEIFQRNRATLWNFFHAVRAGDHVTVKVYLSNIPECVYWADNEGRNVIHLAVIHRHLELCKVLLESEASLIINVRDKFGKTPVRYAMTKQDEVLLKVLFSYGAVADAVNEAGDTILATASSKGYTSVCRILIEDGKADINRPNKGGFTPLHHASVNGHESTCKLLLSKSADPKSVTFNRFTPLHYAAMRSHYNVCKILLSGGAEPNTKCYDGATPFSLAVQTNDKEICKLLLDNKADQNITDNIGKCPLHFACEAGNEEICHLILDSPSTDVNIRDKKGVTPLQSAVRQNNLTLCFRLLHYKANPNLEDNRKKTPLHYSCESYSSEICLCLLEEGADPNCADVNGNTPLHFAAKHGPGVTALNVQLVLKGASLTAKNKLGQTPKSFALWNREEETILKGMAQRHQYSKLLSQGNDPIDTVKLFFCGDPRAGKTSLKNSLTSKKSLIERIRFFERQRKVAESEESTSGSDLYDSTPGIDIATERIPKAGKFSLWDCAGQVEYHLTHGMFMGVDNSIFTVTYDICQTANQKWTSLKYWLSFIRAGHSPRQQSKPRIVIIASHLDRCRDKDSAFRGAERLLTKARETFKPHLDISSELVVVDARLPTGESLEVLKENLRKTAEEIKGTKRVPTLCKKIKSAKGSWGRDDYPVLSWSDYFMKVSKEIDSLVTEDVLKIATLYLHDMGEVYFAELADREHQVILNTKWFSYDIIGAAFASDDFPVEFEKLPECRVYSRKQLQEFFRTSADIDLLIALLQHVDLLHRCGHDKYIVPGKLPEALDKVCWRKERDFEEYHGRRLQCSQDVDIFAPDVFPCIQTRVMEELKMVDEPASISRSTVKFASGSVEGMIQLSHDKRAINIACRCRGGGDREACQDLLSRVTRLAKLEIIKRSPGTQAEMFYLSPRSLYAHDDLEDVWYYSEDDLMKAERDGQDSVKHRATGNIDKISSILCMGYDSLFLQIFKANCSIQWVPHTVKKELYRCLDAQSSRRDDYRSLAEVLGISPAELLEIEKNATGSVSESIITSFCNRENTKMSLGLFRAILSHPGLVDSKEALQILDDLLSEKGIEHSQTNVNIIPTDMNIYHIAWRATLHLCWDTLRSDIKPSDLHHPFLSEDDEEMVLAEEKARGVRKAAALLLNRLLQTQGWYVDFLESLKIAGANHLVEMLKENYDRIMKTLPMVQVVREKYLQAWSSVMKSQWTLFRSKVVPHTVLPHLSFLSEEDKESILDVEEDIGLSSAADILHNIVRDTSDPSYHKILLTCLRENGYVDVADKLCDEFNSVLDGHDYKFIRVHSENMFPL